VLSTAIVDMRVRFFRLPLAFSLALAVGLCAPGCSDDTKDDDKDDETDVVADALDAGTSDDGGLVDTGSPDGSSSGGTKDSGAAKDTGPVDTGAPDDTGGTTDEDTGPVDTYVPPVDAGPECTNANDCTAKVNPKVCEQPACSDGMCTVELKKGACCEDLHCNDAKECTTDKCVQKTNVCEHKNIPNCCSGKLTFHKTDFETDFGDLAAKEGPTNGNVKWQLTTKRAHKGKQSLYFGNACGTYDNSQKKDNSCAPGSKGTAVSGTLTTKAFQLPADKQTQLHFWLFMQAEAMYADTLPKGKCAKPCDLGSSCVNINGSSQCLPEKDNLVVQVVASKSGTKTVFDSTSIGKTTKGKWRRVLVDLDPYKGESVQIRWAFSTGTKHNNGNEGVYLDALVMETVCAVQGTLCGPSAPCLDDSNPCTSEACSLYANKPGNGVCFHDKVPGCCTNADECDDGQPCTTDTCEKGTCDNTPDTSKPGCCKPAVLLNDDFDSGVLTDWALTSNSQLVKWRINPSGGSKKSQALYFGASSFDSYHDPTLGKGKGPKGSACTKKLTFKTGTVFNLVSFKLQLITEFSWLPKAKYKNPPLLGKPKYDYLFVTANVDGTLHEVWTSDLIYGTTDGKWIEVTAPIPAKLGGKTGTLCFNFQAGDDQVNDKQGAHIDELLVRVTCKKAACYFDAECKGKCPDCHAAGCTPTGCGCKKIPGCCTLDKQCDDGDPCTKNSCIGKVCKVAPVKGCCTKDDQCKAKDKCNTGVCDPKTHQCAQKKIDKCCLAAKDCEDFDPCTTQTCDTAKNLCSYKPVKGCCSQDSECDDKDNCTADNCIDGKCYHKKSGKPGCPK